MNMDKCKDCIKYKEEKEKLLLKDDSVTEALEDMKEFIKNCKEICTK